MDGFQVPDRGNPRTGVPDGLLMRSGGLLRGLWRWLSSEKSSYKLMLCSVADHQAAPFAMIPVQNDPRTCVEANPYILHWEVEVTR